MQGWIGHVVAVCTVVCVVLMTALDVAASRAEQGQRLHGRGAQASAPDSVVVSGSILEAFAGTEECS